MKRPIKRRRAQTVSFPAPVQGVVELSPTGQGNTLTAEWVENFIPTQRGLRVRRGVQEFADVTDPVRSMFVFSSGSSEILYAATDDAIYDLTSTPNAVVSSLTSGDWSSQQIGTSGGDFLILANGEDPAQIFDGTTWGALNVTGVDPAALSDVWLYRNRLFFIEKDTLKVWYLGAGNIAGAATDFTLAGIFRRGGSLLFGGTWSLDSGDGIDDKCVFVSTLGEVAVYSGADPSDASTWALEGRYDIGVPVGKRATMQAGGDLFIGTVDGVVPISQAIRKDPAALSLAAVTAPIRATWADQVSVSSQNVEIHKWSNESLMLVYFPGARRVLTANLHTGAWAWQTGWGGNSGTVIENKFYVGREDGKIVRVNVDGNDEGAAFTARVCFSFSDLGDPTAYKSATMARASFFSDSEFITRFGVASDYSLDFPTAPVSIDTGSNEFVWGLARWGEAVWKRSPEDPRVGLVTLWSSVSGTGYAMAPTLQITSGNPAPIVAELVSMDLMVETGGRAN